jgi:hypothetical protein
MAALVRPVPSVRKTPSRVQRLTERLANAWRALHGSPVAEHPVKTVDLGDPAVSGDAGDLRVVAEVELSEVNGTVYLTHRFDVPRRA